MEQKYTAKQWSEIEGGHTMSEDKQPRFGFISNLTESKMYRTRQQAQSADMRSVLDFAFINTIALYIMYNDYNTAPSAQSYAQQTFKYRNFDIFRQRATDLYVAYNQIKTGNTTSNKGAIQSGKTKLPEAKLKQFYTAMSAGNEIPNPRSFFMELERSFDIQDSSYRGVRRMAQDWKDLSSGQRKLIVTRILQFYRTKAIRSELYPIFKKYAKSNGLELKGVDNAEKKGLGIGTKTAIATVGGYVAGRQLAKWLANH